MTDPITEALAPRLPSVAFFNDGHRVTEWQHDGGWRDTVGAAGYGDVDGGGVSPDAGVRTSRGRHRRAAGPRPGPVARRDGWLRWSPITLRFR